jgi:hypothetical protein
MLWVAPAGVLMVAYDVSLEWREGGVHMLHGFGAHPLITAVGLFLYVLGGALLALSQPMRRFLRRYGVGRNPSGLVVLLVAGVLVGAGITVLAIVASRV